MEAEQETSGQVWKKQKLGCDYTHTCYNCCSLRSLGAIAQKRVSTFSLELDLIQRRSYPDVTPPAAAEMRVARRVFSMSPKSGDLLARCALDDRFTPADRRLPDPRARAWN